MSAGAPTPPGRPAGRLIRDVLSNDIAREILGHPAPDDLKVLRHARDAGELSREVNPIFASGDPVQAARASAHPVARILAKLPPDLLRALAGDCPPYGCP